jgi:hypothetical protein
MSSAGDHKVEAKGTMTHVSEGDMQQGTKGNHVVRAAQNSSHDSGQSHATTTGQDHSIAAQGSHNVMAKTSINHNSSGDHNLVASGTHNVQAQVGITHTTAGVHKLTAATGQSTTHPVAFVPPPTPTSPQAAGQPNTNVAPTNTTAPSDVDIHEGILKFSSKRTGYIVQSIVSGLRGIYDSFVGEGSGGDLPADIKKEVDRHFGAGEWENYKQTVEQPFDNVGASDTQQAAERESDPHTGII